MAEPKRRQEISLGKRLAQWLEAPFRPVAFGLRGALRQVDAAPVQRLAERCTPKALQRVLLSIVLFFACLWAFGQAAPLLQAAAPAAYAQETPELVNTVSFGEDTTMESLVVQWKQGPITVRPYDGNKIVVNEYADRGLKTEEKCTVYLASHALSVDWEATSLPIVDSGIGGGLYKRLEVLIPREQAGALEYIRILSGESDITVTDVSNSVSFRVENTVGEITLENVKAPLAVLATQSGSIDCTRLNAGDLQLHSFSGAVTMEKCRIAAGDLRSVEGPITLQGEFNTGAVQTYTGDVTLTLAQMPSAVTLSSVEGNITVTQPKNTPANRLTAESLYGKEEIILQ